MAKFSMPPQVKAKMDEMYTLVSRQLVDEAVIGMYSDGMAVKEIALAFTPKGHLPLTTLKIASFARRILTIRGIEERKEDKQ